jgi:hypothetical protein
LGEGRDFMERGADSSDAGRDFLEAGWVSGEQGAGLGDFDWANCRAGAGEREAGANAGSDLAYPVHHVHPVTEYFFNRMSRINRMTVRARAPERRGCGSGNPLDTTLERGQ